VTDTDLSELRDRARALAEDLNFSTLGWRIPSDRLVEDFAAQGHRLRAEEHEVVDLDAVGERRRTRRAFSLFAPERDDLVGLLLERPESGWSLLLADER
jgi:hypothetical protein